MKNTFKPVDKFYSDYQVAALQKAGCVHSSFSDEKTTGDYSASNGRIDGRVVLWTAKALEVWENAKPAPWPRR